MNTVIFRVGLHCLVTMLLVNRADYQRNPLPSAQFLFQNSDSRTTTVLCFNVYRRRLRGFFKQKTKQNNNKKTVIPGLMLCKMRKSDIRHIRAHYG